MEKVKMVEIVIQGLGLSSQEVVDYWIRQGKVKTEAAQENLQNVKNRSVVNLYFPVDDIRSQTLLFWYAFEGKKFSPDPYAYPNCQGVVGWINPDPNAPEGDRVYVVLPEQIDAFFSSESCDVRTDDLYDGRANTKTLIEYGKAHNVKFPAAEYAYYYTKNGVKQGEAFLPAREQLERVCISHVGIRKALRLIVGTFTGSLLSSSKRCGAWLVDYDGDDMHEWGGARFSGSVSCFIAY